jgi:outer membrane protein
MYKIILVFVSLLTIIVTFLLFKVNKIPNIAYVKSADLIYGYEGMREAQQLQQKKTDQLKSNIDTLQLDFQKTVNEYNLDFPKLSKQERITREKLLLAQQNNLKQYTKNIQGSIEQSDNKLTEGVLNQINSFVEEYAKQHGYDMVFGTTTSGNILYAGIYMDITNDVLSILNAKYRNTLIDTTRSK